MEYSLTYTAQVNQIMSNCFNPYSNGILSDAFGHGLATLLFVLILILMEYSLTVRNGQLF